MIAAPALDELRKLPLLLGPVVADLLREGVGHALVKERLLLRDDNVLVACGADGQPRQHEAGREDREQKDERNLLHGDFNGSKPERVDDGKAGPSGRPANAVP